MKRAAWLLLALGGCAAPPPKRVADAPIAAITEAAAQALAPGSRPVIAPEAPAARPGEQPAMTAAEAATNRSLRRIALAPFLVDPWNRTASPRLGGEPAPVPNRGLDPAFSQPGADPSFGPTLIGPRSAPDPTTAVGPGHRTRDDRLFQQPAAGASLRVPLAP